MNARDLELIRDYLDGRMAPDSLEALNHLLENDAGARARFRALSTLEEGLRDLAEVPAISRNQSPFPTLLEGSVERSTRSGRVITTFFKRPAFAAAAGLMIGVFCTSAVWAATESGRQRILTLIHESFEFGPAPEVAGIPLEPGVWSGDFTEVVAEWEGILPEDGGHMLRFVRADHQGKENPVGYVGDLYQVIDLHGYESTLANDDAVVAVESAFRSVPFDDPDRFVCGMGIYALSTLPSGPDDWKQWMSFETRMGEESLATAQRWITLAPDATEWQKGQVELRLPMESRFLMIAIHVSDRSAIQPEGEPPAVEFSGQFLDDVRVVLKRRTSEF